MYSGYHRNENNRQNRNGNYTDRYPPRYGQHQDRDYSRNQYSRNSAFSFKLDTTQLGQPHFKERGVLIYQRIGEKGERKINNDNLIDRKSTILQKAKDPENLDIEVNDEINDSDSDVELANWGKGRYFGTFFCRRCKEEGHFESNCTKLIDNYSCIFCLGQHTADACTSVVCFKCFSQGHKIRNCPSGGGNRPCPICEKKHTGECGVMIYYSKSLKRDPESIYCFYCGGK